MGRIARVDDQRAGGNQRGIVEIVVIGEAEGATPLSALMGAPLAAQVPVDAERDVVALLLSGASTREIASETNLTVGTVHTYLKRIYPKLGVRSRVELVARMAGTTGVASTMPPRPDAAPPIEHN